MGTFSRLKLTSGDAGVDHRLVATVDISYGGVVQFYAAEIAAITGNKIGLGNPVAGEGAECIEVSVDTLVGIVSLIGFCCFRLIACSRLGRLGRQA